MGAHGAREGWLTAILAPETRAMNLLLPESGTSTLLERSGSDARAPDAMEATRVATVSAAAPILEMTGVSITFETRAGSFTAVRDFNLTLGAGRKLAIVGESGSGKSTIAMSINGLLAENGRVSGGSIRFGGRDVVGLGEREFRKLRGSEIGLVPQDPMTNLNPLQRIGTQIREVFDIHGTPAGGAPMALAAELLDAVGIPEPERRLRQFPHELSGGMRQRVLIAMALACRPKLLIADEPTSALDVTVQRLILDKLCALTEDMGTALIFITHDLPLAAERADEIVVMHKGEVVESGTIAGVMRTPTHAYTQRLLRRRPDAELAASGRSAGSTAQAPERTR